MASKFQKRNFPHEKLAKFQSIVVSNSKGETVEIDYQDLNLVFQNGQLCFYYESSDGDLLMPIARERTVLSLFKTGFVDAKPCPHGWKNKDKCIQCEISESVSQ